ncbi:MAG: glycosyltransferase family 4 protein [Ignavibacteriaceae bacterium]|jgi:glycosyltransferase involved in cell wall biosynthesis
MSSNKAIIFFCDGNFIGGAQSRYINLINHINNSGSDDYLMIINKEFYDAITINNQIKCSSNILPITIRKKYSPSNSLNLSIPKKNKIKLNNREKKFKKLRNIKWLLGKYIEWFSFSLQCSQIIRKYNIKTIYSVWKGGIWIWPLKFILGFRLIHSYNDSSVASLSKSVFRVFDSEYWVLKYCDKIDFLSLNYVNLLERVIGKIDSNRISITPNSFIIYDSYYPVYPKENDVIFMARFISYKNPILFLESVKYFNKLNFGEKVNFFIIGEGSLENDIKEFIKVNKLQNVTFIGKIFHSWTYLRKSKVFISIQDDENYPSQSLLEAMACENAIIASDVGETRKLVTESEGILVNLDKESIANALINLLSNPLLMETLSKNARRKVLSQHTIEKYEEYFKKLLEP